MNHESPPALLFVDDEIALTQSLLRALRAKGLDGIFHAASNAEAAKDIAERERPLVAIVDLSLNSDEGAESGLRLVEHLVRRDPTCRVIVLTGQASTSAGVNALRRGAAHFLAKPAEIEHLLALIHDGISQAHLRRSVVAFQQQQEHTPLRRFVGTSTIAHDLVHQITAAARTSQKVLICGETGTGKGVCARLIHDLSSRAKQHFVRYQPGGRSVDLVASDLFGHTRGAFTGATGEREGLILEADHGTLFLDEVDELPIETQVSLLGPLQERTVRRIGSNREESTDFRLICASNADLERCRERGKMREDFFHRIAGLRIELPPLRDRRGDIPALSHAFLAALCARGEVGVSELSGSAIEALQQWRWPGNIRELESVIEQAAYRAHLTRSLYLEAEHLPSYLQRRPLARTEPSLSFHDQVERYKMSIIESALSQYNHNQVHTAQALGLDRSTLRRIIERNQQV